MSLTAAGFLGVYALSLILALCRHPLFGLFAYLWAFYQHPISRWWGTDLPDLRWSLIAAAVALIAALRTRPGGAHTTWHESWGARFALIFVAWIWFQTAWAVNADYHLDGAILFTKYAVLFYTLYRLLGDIHTLEIFSWAHVFGCFIWGWIAYTTPVRGRLEMVLGPGVDDSNVVGFHLITGLAFASFMFLGISGKRRWAAFATIPFIMNGIILTVSRGALLGMLGAGLVGLFLGPRAHRFRLYGSAMLGVILFLWLAHEPLWERVATLRTTEEDEMDTSAASRIAILEAGWRMFQDHPLGTGHRGNEVLSPQYVPAQFLTEGRRSAHNTFMAVLVDHGLPGAAIFLALVLWAAFRLLGLKSLDRLGLPPSLGIYRAAVGSGLAAYLVSGQFINLLKAEVGLWLIALLVVLDNLCLEAIQRGSQTRGDKYPK